MLFRKLQKPRDASKEVRRYEKKRFAFQGLEKLEGRISLSGISVKAPGIVHVKVK